MNPDLDPSIRALFAAGPGDEPPLGLTPSAVLASGRAARRRRLQTFTAAGSGVSVAAVVTAVTIGTLGAAPGTSRVADGGPDEARPCATVRPGSTPPTPVPRPPTTSPTGRIPVTPTGRPAVTPPAPTASAIPVTPPAPTATTIPVTPTTPTASAIPVTPTTRWAPLPRGTADVTPPAPSTSPEGRPRGTAEVTPPAPSTARPGGTAEATPPAPVPVSPGATCVPPAPEPGPTRIAAPESEADRLARLTATLRRVLPLPAGGTLVRSTAAPAGVAPLAFYAGKDGDEPDYGARADVRDPLGRSSVEVTIKQGAPPSPDYPGDPCEGLDACTSTWTAQGDLVVVSRHTEGTGTALMALASHADGTSVFVSVTDFSLNDHPATSATPPRSQRPTHLWTRTQLTTATLTLHP